MNTISQNFKLLSSPARIREVWRPNYTGPELVKLNSPVPARLQQTGLIAPAYVSEITAGKGDPNTIVANLNAINLGYFANVWKEDAWADPVMTSENGLVFYTIIWKQLSA